MGNLCSFVAQEKKVTLYSYCFLSHYNTTFFRLLWYLGRKRNNNINFCKTILFLYFQKSSPPHSLEDLLNTIPINDDITTTTARVNVVIRDNIWLQKFADFLQRRKLEDDLTILKFLIMIQV